MPQPDILLLRPDLDESRAPHPEDVLLLVEVADSSLVYDQTDKRDAYAFSGIAEYCLLDLTRNELQIFREPQASAYQSITVLRRGKCRAIGLSRRDRSAQRFATAVGA